MAEMLPRTFPEETARASAKELYALNVILPDFKDNEEFASMDDVCEEVGDVPFGK